MNPTKTPQCHDTGARRRSRRPRTATPQLRPAEHIDPRQDLRIAYRAVDSLAPYARNPRTHSPTQIKQIAESIRTFGFTNPVLIDRAGGVVAGHGRVEAAKLLGMTEVPTIRLEAMTTAQKQAYVIADNRLAETAGWDRDLLALELGALAELDLDFDLTVTGFETAEIDVLIGGAAQPEDPAADALPATDPQAPPVSRPGDLWVLGAHRLLCDDSTDPAAFARLLARSRAQMAFLDPPYNVPIDGHATGLGRTRHREFMMASGEMSEAEFTLFLVRVLRNIAGHSRRGAVLDICMDWRGAYPLQTAARQLGLTLLNCCVWRKDNGGMGSLYRSQHELVFIFKSGKGSHINNVELGRHGRYRTNVWDYAGVNTLRAGRLEDLAMHPTVKPVALVADALLDCSRRGGLVLDAFAGSGTTIIAAEKTGRKAAALELDPVYVDTAVRRWEAYTGETAIHADSGESFAAVAQARGHDPDHPPGRPATRRGRRASRAVEASHAR
ncbi:DNA methyltransferase [Rhodospirillaceae bacterium SYSU D60014]|uniref:site-specific DNA-methyltransferase n=1 Tax=Virgifigura deserti TaxID=2268457 RepID=UPI000E65F5E9